MILVDSSVWIDYFRSTVTPQTDCLDALLPRELLAVGDLILTEVLQGFASEREFNQARKLLTSLDIINIGGQDTALAAARNFRTLRAASRSGKPSIPCSPVAASKPIWHCCTATVSLSRL